MQVVKELNEPVDSKACRNTLFQWRVLRRLGREDIKMYGDAMMRHGIEQIEYPACTLITTSGAEATAEDEQTLVARAQVLSTQFFE